MWTVTGMGDLREVNSLLNAEYNDTTRVIMFPATLLGVGFFRVRLYAVNFLGASSAVSVSLYVLQTVQAATSRILGPSVIKVFRSDQLLVDAAPAELTSCTPQSDKNVRYRWKLSDSYDTTLNWTSSSLNPRSFMLPPYTLRVGNQYQLSLTVDEAKSNSSSTSSVVIDVLYSGVKAIIAGGGVENTLSSAIDNMLDASSSYNLDNPTDSRLTYAWSCIQLKPLYGSSCNNLALGKSAVLKIPAGLLSSTTCLFTVYVTAVENGLQDKTSRSVTFLNATLPVINMAAPALSYSWTDRVILTATVLAEDSFLYSWSCMNESVSLQNMSSSPLSKMIRIDRLTTVKLQMSLRPYVLQSGFFYSFVLHASYPNASSIAFASISIKISFPPTGGIFKVSPRRGVALNTSFLFVASNWYSLDSASYPLYYTMLYYSASPLESVIIQASSVLPYASSFVGQGAEASSFAVHCFLIISDSQGVTTNSSQDIAVTPNSGLLEQITALISQIELATLSFNGNEVSQLVGGIVTALNYRNCSAAPDCRQLHRYPCSSTTNTCGKCLPGYTGLPWDANTGCVGTANAMRVMDACTSDSECITGLCVNFKCASSVKPCANNCSGAGTCVFYNTLSQSTLITCAYSDSYCQAKCICNAGYAGYDCSLTRDELVLRQQLRRTMCLALHDALAYQV